MEGWKACNLLALLLDDVSPTAGGTRTRGERIELPGELLESERELELPGERVEGGGELELLGELVKGGGRVI